jgi:hypothetical protein
MVFGPETFLRLVVPPFGEPPSVGSGRDCTGFFFRELLEDAVRRVFLAFEQPEPVTTRRLATMARRRI